VTKRSIPIAAAAGRQVPVKLVSVASVMRHPNFRRGFEDARNGRPPCFDEFADKGWAYERGRLFAHVAPVSIPLFVDGRLNSFAIRLFKLADDRALIP
jgi:hypothetical protein